MAEHYPVVVGAGSLRAADGVTMPHAWTPGGVSLECTFSGAHVLHLAVAGCVLNDVYREAARLGLSVDGVRVAADGDFDGATWQSTGISYEVDLDSDLGREEIARLLEIVDEVAEIPRALRQGTTVKRLSNDTADGGAVHG